MHVGARLFGMGGVATVALIVLGAALFTWRTATAPPAPPALSVFDVTPPASPPETPPAEQDAPKPVRKRETRPDPVPVPRVQPTIVPIVRATAPLPQPEIKAADPAPPQRETGAPRTLPAPPAPQISSNGPDSWEGRVLAQLNGKRRYPPWSMSRREQGAPYVRFVIDRDGKVLSSRLERSSGFPDLDREAVALPRRASPLPKPPADRPGDTVELIAPVEFFLAQ